MNLPEVQKLLGYSTGPESKMEKDIEHSNVIDVAEHTQQPQQQAIQQTVQQEQSQPQPIAMAAMPQVSQMQVQIRLY